jgi:uncharacterized protein YhbP (UPF0306 family)
MEKRMIDFMQGQRVATICCVDEQNNPYCFSCFYAFDAKDQLFYFKSSPATHHAILLHQKPLVAGTIQPDRLNPLAIKGVQFNGEVLGGNKALSEKALAFYHKKYPFALAVPGEMWIILADMIKMTDNTLSFGKKLVWQRKKPQQLVHAG